MSSLDDLYSKLQAINNQFNDVGDFDQYYNFEGVSFDRSHNESLGLSGKPEDFITKIPYIEYQDPPVDPATVAKKPWPSALQAAFMDVLEAGKAKDGKSCFIDICSWAGDAEFFTENIHQSAKYTIGGQQYTSVVEKVFDLINACDPGVTPVIRMIGVPYDKAEKLFWDGNNLRVPLTRKSSTNPPMIYAGTYGPKFQASDPDTGPIHQWLNDRLSFVDDYREKLINAASSSMSNDLKTLLRDDVTKQKVVDYLTKTGLTDVSFTHAKFLAVNGKVLMTGGANHSGYLNKVHPTDNNSLGMRTPLADKSNWQPVCQPPAGSPLASNPSTVVAPAPLFVKTFPSFTRTKNSNLPVLTVARLGSWHGYQLDLDYPSQIIDALRDLITTLVYQKLQGSTKQGVDTLLTLASMTDDGDFWQSVSALFDQLQKGFSMPNPGGSAIDVNLNTVLAKLGDQKDTAQKFIDWWTANKDKYKSDLNPYHRLKINPTAWASRFARNAVIAHAQKSVVICQPYLAGWLQLDQQPYQDLVASLNQHGLNNWDGVIWGYDLFVALAYFLCTISSEKSDDYGIFMLLSTHTQMKKENVWIRDRWNDPVPAQQIKDRVKVMMKAVLEIVSNPAYSLAAISLGGKGFFTSYGLNFSSQIDVDALVDKKLHIKRVFKGDGAWVTHIKSVCVDDKMMYVGSDNAYPHYNEEHGIWIDDQTTIQKWKDDYWTKYWNNSTDAFATTESGEDINRMQGK